MSILLRGKYHKNARLGFKQSTIHAGFALWIYSLLTHYCQAHPLAA
nr:LAGLIDADG-like domain-containing protein [Rhizophagus clarus]